MTLDEMNNLIAEKVMGWQRYNTFLDSNEIKPVLFYQPIQQSVDTPLKQAPDFCRGEGAFLLIVENLVQEGHIVFMKGDGLRTYPNSLKYTVCIDNHPRSDAKTLPMAVCLAALRFKGVEIETAGSRQRA